MAMALTVIGCEQEAPKRKTWQLAVQAQEHCEHIGAVLHASADRHRALMAATSIPPARTTTEIQEAALADGALLGSLNAISGVETGFWLRDDLTFCIGLRKLEPDEDGAVFDDKRDALIGLWDHDPLVVQKSLEALSDLARRVNALPIDETD